MTEPSHGNARTTPESAPSESHENGPYGTTVTSTFGNSAYTISLPAGIVYSPDTARLRATEHAFQKLWRAFLLLACQFVVVAIAAVWGWAR